MSSDLKGRRPRRWRDEAGIALPGAMLAVFALSSLMGMVVVTAVGQNRAAGFQQRYEASVHLAEGAAEMELLRTFQDATHVTTSMAGTPHTVPSSVDVTNIAALGQWARAQSADARWDHMPAGRGFGIRPIVNGSPAPFVLGVGRATDRTRVVRLDLSSQLGGRLQFGLLTGSSLLVGGYSTLTNDVTEAAAAPSTRYATPLPAGQQRFGMHTNDSMVFNSGTVHVDGGITASGAFPYPHNYSLPGGGHPYKCAGANNCHPSNPAVNSPAGPIYSGGGQPVQPMPDFSARAMYELNGAYTAGDYGPRPPAGQPWPITGNWFDLCPDGTVRQPDQSPPRTPCTGSLITPGNNAPWPGVEGWSYRPADRVWNRMSVNDAPFRPLPSNPHEVGSRARHSAVWYVYQASVEVNSSFGVPQTIIAEADPTDGGRTGNIRLGGDGGGYAALLEGLLFLADRDLIMGATFNSDAFGLALAGESVEMSGDFDLVGAVVARNDPDTLLSTIHDRVCGNRRADNGMCGSANIIYDGSAGIPGTAGGPFTVTRWTEL